METLLEEFKGTEATSGLRPGKNREFDRGVGEQIARADQAGLDPVSERWRRGPDISLAGSFRKRCQTRMALPFIFVAGGAASRRTRRGVMFFNKTLPPWHRKDWWLNRLASTNDTRRDLLWNGFIDTGPGRVDAILFAGDATANINPANSVFASTSSATTRVDERCDL